MQIPIISRLFKARASPITNWWNSVGSFFFGSTSSGKTVNERTAMSMTAVYACVRIIAETIASLPLHTYKYTPNGKEKAVDHPLYYLLHDEPNKEMTSFVFRETLMGHLLLWGNAYCQIIRDGRGVVLELYPLMPDRMIVDRMDNGELFYTYNKDGSFVYLRNDEVLHISGLGFDGIMGHSPIAMAKNAIGMAISAEDYGARFFANDARPSVVLEHPGVVKDPQRLRDSWNSVFQGSGNSHKVAILEEGMALKTISLPPDQSQFIESRKFQINEICRIFRVPPHMVADLEKSSFSNIEQQAIDFIDNTIVPWAVRLEQSLQRGLLPVAEKRLYCIKFNLTARLRGDAQSRAAFYQTMRQNGIMSTNDIRQLEDMNLIPEAEGGFKLLVNGNMVDIARAGDWTTKYNNENQNEGGASNA